MSEVKNEGLEVVDVRAIVTDAFISMMESALGMKAPDCAPPAFIQSAIDRAIDRINSEAIVGYAVRDSRIATQEAQIKALQSGENSWQSGYDEGRRMGAKHCMGTIDQLRAELAALNAKLDASKFCADVADDLRAELAAIKAQEPVAYEVSSYGGRVNNIVVREDVALEQADRMISEGAHEVRVRALYAAPIAKQVVMPERKDMTRGFDAQRTFAMGWNAYADEYNRLNAADQGGGV